MMRSEGLIFCLLLFCSVCFADSDIYNEHNNIVDNPYAENDWQSWYHSQNTQIADESCGAGTKSFQLNPSVGTHSDIRSVKLVAEPGQKLKFKYSYKSSNDASIDPSSSYARVRFYDSGSSFISQAQFELVLTQGQWQHYSFEEITVPNGAEELDIRFITGGVGGNAQGTFYIDDIYLYQELPGYKSCDNYPTQLYVIDKSYISNEEYVLIQSLQGLIAQTKPEIYIDRGNDEYLIDLQVNHGVNYTRIDSLFWYMNRYSDDLNGYILADLDDGQSIAAATSLSGILNAAIVDDSLESYVQGFGLSKLVDTRGKDCVWVYNNYWDQLNKNGIIVKNPNISESYSAFDSLDWFIALKLMWWWYDSEPLSSEVYEAVIDSSHCYGWEDAYAGGELGTVNYHSQFSLYTGASTSASNKSVLAGMANKYPQKQYHQPISDVNFTTEPGVHYVAFQITDMDNMGVHLKHNGWHTNTDYYANSHRGQFPMGWGMPAPYVELAPTVMEYWYREATNNDSFIVPCGGLGYMYPSLSPELFKNTRKLSKLMKRADLHNVLILDAWWTNPLTETNYYPIAHYFSRLDEVRGLFYADVNGDYARYGREADAGRAQRIYWFDGKPLVPCRYTLWDGGQYEGISRTPSQLAASINALPTNPADPASYTFVMVHAWSYGLDDVYQTVQQLDSNVRVVTPEELIEQIYMNLSPCGTAPLKADINNDCQVNLIDFSRLAQDWLTVGDIDEDLTGDEKIDLEDLSYFHRYWMN